MRGQRGPRNQKRRRLRRRRMRLPPGGFENDTRGEDGGRMRRSESAGQSLKTRSGAACDAAGCAGAPGRIRTVDTRFRRAVLYPLSYGGK